MKPILFESTDRTFRTMGIGTLAEALSCIVTEERNGAFILEMKYPVSGHMYAELTPGRIILADPRPNAEPQPFRIAEIKKGMSGTVMIRANHISYDLSGIVANPFEPVSGANLALITLFGAASTENPFTAVSSDATPGTFGLTTPASIRSRLGGVEGSILDVFGGEFEWDGYTVRHYGARGQDRGVRIEYGVNLTSLEQETNISEVFTGVYPFWASPDGDAVVRLTDTAVAPEAPLVKVTGTFDRERIAALDLSQDFQDQPTQQQLYDAAQKYITSNNIGRPKVSLEVSFLDLAAVQGTGFFERVDLCDTVHVYFSRLGIEASARVIAAEYNVLLDRYEKLTLGDARSSLASTVVGLEKTVRNSLKTSEARSYSALENAVKRATELITGETGGYVKINTNAAGQPYEILIMDTPDVETAAKVWRWNNAGLGYSRSGYSGPYETAITQDGQIVANFITTGTLDSDVINVATLFARDILATGDIQFDNGLYSIKSWPDGSVRIGTRGDFWVWGEPITLNSYSWITISCAGLLKLEGSRVEINGDNSVDINSSLGDVRIQGKKIKFGNDNVVRWEAAT